MEVLGLKKGKKLTPAERLIDLDVLEKETRTSLSGTLTEIEGRLNQINSERTKIKAQIEREEEATKESARKGAINAAFEKYGTQWYQAEQRYRTTDNLLLDLAHSVLARIRERGLAKEAYASSHAALINALRDAQASEEEIASKVPPLAPTLRPRIAVAAKKVLATADLGSTLQSMARETNDWRNLPPSDQVLIVIDRSGRPVQGNPRQQKAVPVSKTPIREHSQLPDEAERRASGR